MGTYTTNLDLYKPTVGEQGWGTLVNENFDKIDTASSVIGVIQMYAGSTAPNGWLVCNGQAVSRTTYAALYAVIGTTYGVGDGSTTFNVPDLQGRVPIGVSSSHELGSVGGSETHILSIEELAEHNHDGSSLTTNSTGAHTHSLTGNTTSGTNTSRIMFGNATAWATIYTNSTGAHTHTIEGDTGSSGGGLPHNNMQPYVTLNYIIRVK